jgi:hypothetical protein
VVALASLVIALEWGGRRRAPLQFT